MATDVHEPLSSFEESEHVELADKKEDIDELESAMESIEADFSDSDDGSENYSSYAESSSSNDQDDSAEPEEEKRINTCCLILLSLITIALAFISFGVIINHFHQKSKLQMTSP